jgi:hypothetical protein
MEQVHSWNLHIAPCELAARICADRLARFGSTGHIKLNRAVS